HVDTGGALLIDTVESVGVPAGTSRARQRRRTAHALLAALSVWAAMAVGRYGFLFLPGLRARYFTTIDWSGPSARESVDGALSTQQVARDWGFLPPDAFSARFSGYLWIDGPGSYAFATTSDDGSDLAVDGQLVVDNSGSHGAQERRGSIALERGSHAV